MPYRRQPLRRRVADSTTRYYHGWATHGSYTCKWSTAVAASDDLFKWETYPGNPLLPVAEKQVERATRGRG